MKKSINIEAIYSEIPFKERFKKAKEDGFDFVEFWGWEDKDLDEVNTLLSDNGLKMSAMSGDGPFSMCDRALQDKYIDFIKKSVEAAKKIGCPSLVIHSDTLEEWPQYAVKLSEEYSELDKFLTMFDTLKKIAPLAEDAGITFVLEALNIEKDHKGNFLSNTTDSVSLVKATGSPNMKVLYDAYHMYLDEGKICETLSKYIDYIGYIHIADAPGRNEPGTGAINYTAVFHHLKSLNYSKVIGFELYPKTDSDTAVKAMIASCDGLM